VLLVATNGIPSLQLAGAKTWNIGDHCSWLSVKADGTRTLSDGQIVGSQSPSPWGERIDISGDYEFASVGGALLNDQGEVIGVLGGALPDSLLHGYQCQSLGDTSELAFGLTGGIAVASTLLASVFGSSRDVARSLERRSNDGSRDKLPIRGLRYVEPRRENQR